MNVTEANPQDILSQHYNQANLYFQSGEFEKALEELNSAKQYAADENQLQHINNTMLTIKDSMQQNQTPAAPAASIETEDEEDAGSRRPNGMMVLAILVGLICITPIVMKFVEVFSQPRQTTVAETPVAPAEGSSEEVASNSEAPAAPEPTPAMIVNAEAPANAPVNMLVSGSNVNMRAEASVQSARVTTLAQGTRVEAIGDTVNAGGFVWQQVKTPTGATGWVASKFLQAQAVVVNTEPVSTEPISTAPAEAIDSTVAQTPVAATETVMQVPGTGVSIRSLPSTTGEKILSLSQTQVTVVQAKAAEADGYTWSKIRTRNGTEGWVAHQFLSP